MSIETIKVEVRGLLARTNDKIARAEWTLAADSAGARVRAAGRLVGLRRHRQMLEARMDELDHARGDAVSSAIQWFKEEWMLLAQSFEA